MESPPQSPSPPPAPPRANRTKQIIIVVIVVVLVLAAVGVAFNYAFRHPASSNLANTQTWQQWGMSLQYPSGLKTQLNGVLEQQATNDSGEAEWIWNGGDTGLGLLWINTTNYNLTAGMQSTFQKIQSLYSNVTLVDQSTTMMAGATWQYETLRFSASGQTAYSTFAFTYFTNSHRVYELFYTDINPSTLNSLMKYGNTFKG